MKTSYISWPQVFKIDLVQEQSYFQEKTSKTMSSVMWVNIKFHNEHINKAIQEGFRLIVQLHYHNLLLPSLNKEIPSSVS